MPAGTLGGGTVPSEGPAAPGQPLGCPASTSVPWPRRHSLPRLTEPRPPEALASGLGAHLCSVCQPTRPWTSGLLDPGLPARQRPPPGTEGPLWGQTRGPKKDQAGAAGLDPP